MANKKKRVDDGYEEDIPGVQGTRTFVSDTTIATSFTIYMDSDVSDPDKYRDDIELIKTAEEQDVITIYFNTRGGDLVTALSFIEAIEACKGTTIGHVGPECASAGSMMALKCKRWIITPFSSMMIHTVKYGAYGKDVDVKRQVDFEHRRTRRLWNDIYKDFLTPAEIDSVLTNGEEIWLDADDLQKRFANFVKIRGGELETEEPEQKEDVEVDSRDPLTWPEGSIVQLVKAHTPFKKGDTAIVSNFVKTQGVGEIIEIVDESEKWALILPYDFDKLSLVETPDEEEE